MILYSYLVAGMFICIGLLLGFISWADCPLRSRRVQKFFQVVFGLTALFLITIGILNIIALRTLLPEKTQIVQSYYMEDKIPIAITVQGDKFQILTDHGINFTNKGYSYITYRPLKGKVQEFFFDGCFERLYIPQEKN